MVENTSAGRRGGGVGVERGDHGMGGCRFEKVLQSERVSDDDGSRQVRCSR